MSVGFCLNLVDLVYLELVTGVKQYNRSSGSKYVTLRTQAHPNALARSQWEVVKFSCKIPVHHMPHFSNLRPAVLVIEDESSAERSRIKGNGNSIAERHARRGFLDYERFGTVPVGCCTCS